MKCFQFQTLTLVKVKKKILVYSYLRNEQYWLITISKHDPATNN